MSKLVRVMFVALSVAGVVSGCTGGGNTSLAGTKWKLAAWSISAQAADEFETTLEFEADQLGGTAPVNSYGGGYTTKSGGAIEIGDINRTLMAGPEPAMQAEDRYFALLEQVKRYSAEGNELTLSDANGNPLLVFEKR